MWGLSFRRCVIPVLGGFLALAPAVPPAAADAILLPYSVPVNGAPADGLLALPDSSAPTQLVVYAHGYGNHVDNWTTHLLDAADRGAVAVAMDYGTTFQLQEGADETVAATLDLLAAYPTLTEVFLLGISMGGAVSGMALAQAPAGTYDYWVDVEGVSTLTETWAEAEGVGHPAAAEIETECGGTPFDAPVAYVHRSPAFHAAEMKFNGLRAAVVVHGVNDGLVPYDQGRQMAAAVAGAAIPVDVYNVLRGDPDELGTTGTGALGLPNPLNLAGHGWEGSSTHIVIATGFEALWGLMDGSGIPPAYREFLVDEGFGTVP